MGDHALTAEAEDEVKNLVSSWRSVYNDLEEENNRKQAVSVSRHPTTLL